MGIQKVSAERLLSTYPQDRQEILQYAERIRKYSHECGCGMGATFMSAAFVLWTIYFFTAGNFAFEAILTRLALGVGFVFGMTALGKLFGMGLARIRLAFVYQQLAQRFPLGGD